MMLDQYIYIYIMAYILFEYASNFYSSDYVSTHDIRITDMIMTLLFYFTYTVYIHFDRIICTKNDTLITLYTILSLINK